jgi:hypothetical protein
MNMQPYGRKWLVGQRDPQYGNIGFLECWKQTLVMKSLIFWHVTQCSSLKANRGFEGGFLLQGWIVRKKPTRNRLQSGLTCLIHAGFLRGLIYNTSKKEATRSSETSVDFQRTTWHYIPKDITLHIHCWENLKSFTESSKFLRVM